MRKHIATLHLAGPLWLALVLVGCTGPDGNSALLPVLRPDFSPNRAPPMGLAQRTAPAGAVASVGWEVSTPRAWRYVVIHHSAGTSGSVAIFDKEHRARGWDACGYHFVICNGDGGGDGEVQIGPRWPIQKQGAHTGATPGNEYNEYGIGICLVGDFSNRGPSAAQLASLNRLTNYLAARYRISPDRVIGHRDAPGHATECPGDVLEAYLRSTLRSNVRGELARR